MYHRRLWLDGTVTANAQQNHYTTLYTVLAVNCTPITVPLRARFTDDGNSALQMVWSKKLIARLSWLMRARKRVPSTPATGYHTIDEPRLWRCPCTEAISVAVAGTHPCLSVASYISTS